MSDSNSEKTTEQATPTGESDQAVQTPPTQVEENASRPNQAGQDDKANENASNAYMRKMFKQFERRFDTLESRFQQPQQTPSQPEPSAPNTQNDFDWSNPNKTVQDVAKHQADVAIREYQRAQKMEEASLWVQSQEDVKTQEDFEAVREVMNRHGLIGAAQANVMTPEQASQLGYKLWREERGIQSQNEAKRTAAKQQAASVQGTPPVGKKVWRRAEVNALYDPKNPAKWREMESEILSATREGRIVE